MKLSISEFHKDQLTFLGYRVSVEGVGMDPEKVVAVKDREAPRIRKHLKAFWGLQTSIALLSPISPPWLCPLLIY